MPKSNWVTESITRIDLKDDDGQHFATIRVWRAERGLGPFQIDTLSITQKVQEFHPLYCREIVEALMKLKNVTQVEWTGRDGCGFVVAKEG